MLTIAEAAAYDLLLSRLISLAFQLLDRAENVDAKTLEELRALADAADTRRELVMSVIRQRQQ